MDDSDFLGGNNGVVSKMQHDMLKLKSFYFFSFFAVGSLTPLLGLYLQEVQQFNGIQIGFIMSLGPIVMMVCQPVWGILCDTTGKPVQVLSLAAAFTSFIGLIYLGVDDYIWFVWLSALLAVFQSAVIPVSDGITMQYASKVKADYGKIRMFGSLGFAVAVFLMGRLSETDIGLNVIFYAFFAGFFLSAVLAYGFPKQPVTASKVKLLAGMKQLLSVKKFLLLLGITFFLFGPNLANNVYYGIFIEAKGGTVAGIGVAFLLAVLSEIPFMRFAGQWIYKIGLLPVVLIACAASTVRFLSYFFEPSLGFIYATSMVQGLSLGLFIPAALQYIQGVVPAAITVTAVTIYSAFGNGLGNWFSTFFSGILMNYYGVFHVYLLFSVMSLVAALLTVRLIVLDKRELKMQEH